MGHYNPKNSTRNQPLQKWMAEKHEEDKATLKLDRQIPNVNKEEKLNLAYQLGATFDYQQKWIEDSSKYRLCVKARQVGMTTTIAIESLLKAIFYNEFVILIVSPSQRQSDRLMWYINKAFSRLQKIIGEPIQLLRHTRDSMMFYHGSEIWSLPNNPTTIMGFDANEVIIDEAGIFPSNEGTQIYEAVMGSLAAKDGGISLSGMPYGRGKFFYDKFEDAQQGKNNFSLHLIPWMERGKQDPKYKKAVEEQFHYLNPIQISQTYGCEFIDENVVLFTYEMLESCIDDTIRLISGDIAYGSNKPVFLGIDFARKLDKTSIVGVEKQEDGKFKVFFVDNTKETYDKQIDLIKKLNITLSPQTIFIDESGPGVPMLDMLTKELGGKVKPIPFSAVNKERLMLNLRNLFSDKKIRIPNKRDMIDELHSIEKTITELGNVRYIAPHEEGGHADMAFALALAVNDIENTDFKFQIL